MSIVTFQFSSTKTFDKVAKLLMGTSFLFSVVYGEVHYNKPNCITVWGDTAIKYIRNQCNSLGISYLEVQDDSY